MRFRWRGLALADLRVKTRVYAVVWTQDPAVGGGIFRSEDGGRTWTASGLAQRRDDAV